MVAHKRRIQPLQALAGRCVVAANDDAVRAHEVIDGAALLEKLGVARHLDSKACATRAQTDCNVPGHPLCSTYRYCRLVHHQAWACQVAPQAVGNAQHMLQIGRTVLLAGRAHGDKHHLGTGQRLLPIIAEQQAARLHAAVQERRQAWLVDRALALAQLHQALRITLQAGHPVAHFGKTGRRYQADIPRPDHTEFHGRAP
ncbi:hypothetical protein D3C80_1463890 [compost metagenome]